MYRDVTAGEVDTGVDLAQYSSYKLAAFKDGGNIYFYVDDALKAIRATSLSGTMNSERELGLYLSSDGSPQSKFTTFYVGERKFLQHE